MSRIISLGLAAVLIGFSSTARAEPPAPAIDAKADSLLKQMGEQLSAAKRFTFEAHSMVDQTLENGEKIQLARNQKIAVRRPDAIAADVKADLEDLRFWYDGKTVTLFNGHANTFGVTDAPPAIDATFDMLAQKFGLTIPLADLLFADPYKTLIANVRSAQYLGMGYVFNDKCHHLAFRQEGVDWQIWLDDGPKPLPRKVVITYKESAGHPQYTSFLSNWNLAADVPDSAFAAQIPAGAKKVEFGPAREAPPQK